MLYKGSESSVDYDGEPSVSKGIVCPNFLRPTCSYTECPLSFQTGSCPTERTTAGYSSCLYFDFTDLPFHIVYGYSVDALPYIILLVFVLMQYLLHSIVIGFLSRTLPDFGIIRNPARLWNNNVVDCLMLPLFLLFQAV